jgi:hypothetical protein
VIFGIEAWKLPTGSVDIGQFVSPDNLNNSNLTVFDGGLAGDKEMSHAFPMYELIKISCIMHCSMKRNKNKCKQISKQSMQTWHKRR